jgi:hypothetical protein
VVKELRAQLRDLIGQSSNLDGILADARCLPPELADLALKELCWLNAQVAELTARVEAVTPPPGTQGRATSRHGAAAVPLREPVENG